jgi:hypothetical protein
MSKISFSLSDYQSGLMRGDYSPPGTLSPFYEVDPVLFRNYFTTRQRGGDLSEAFDEIRKRTGPDYFGRFYPLQARTLDFSVRSFPAYRFILPEVMTEDWLAVVDWGKFQRDHVLHQPLCGYIMLKLLEGDGITAPLTLPNGRTLLDECVDQILKWEGTEFIRDFLLDCGLQKDHPLLDPGYITTRSFWRILFREAAYVAAIFHDLGYPWQYSERIQKNLDGMNTPAVKQNRSAEQILGLFGGRLVFKPFFGYRTPDKASPSTWPDKVSRLTDSAMSKTHGLPGALGFLHLNDCVRKYPSNNESPFRLLCIEWAAAAILMHDMCGIYWGKGTPGMDVPENPFLRLNFGSDPLSALVTLVDFLQDFERPIANFGTSGVSRSSGVSLRYSTGCSSTEFELSGRNLKIIYKMTTKTSLAKKRAFLAKEKIEYFDSNYGYIDMESLGITNVVLVAQ